MVSASKPLVERHAVQPPCMMQLVSCDTPMITEYTIRTNCDASHGLMTCRLQQHYHSMQIERTDKPSLAGCLHLAFPGDAHSTGFLRSTE
ncbi:hypothetical protein E4U46_000261 [Claviceps purpurea]|nr:hypothetical protein E4U46_000261 [Claviceps purpurea]